MKENAALRYIQSNVAPPDPREVNWKDKPLAFKLYPNCEQIPFGYEGRRTGASPVPTRSGGAGADRDKPSPYGLSRGQIGEMLVDIYGLTRQCHSIPMFHPMLKFIPHGGTGTSPFYISLLRPVPSGGALFPCELYLLVSPQNRRDRACPCPPSPNNETRRDSALRPLGGSHEGGQDLPAGIYHYDAAHHALDILAQGDYTSHLQSALAHPADTPPAYTLLLSSYFWKDGFKYGAFSYRLQGLDIGTVISQSEIITYHEGLSTTIHYQFQDKVLNDLLGLDPVYESVYAVIEVRRDSQRGRRDSGLPLSVSESLPTTADGTDRGEQQPLPVCAHPTPLPPWHKGQGQAAVPTRFVGDDDGQGQAAVPTRFVGDDDGQGQAAVPTRFVGDDDGQGQAAVPTRLVGDDEGQGQAAVPTRFVGGDDGQGPDRGKPYPTAVPTRFGTIKASALERNETLSGPVPESIARWPLPEEIHRASFIETREAFRPLHTLAPIEPLGCEKNLALEASQPLDLWEARTKRRSATGNFLPQPLTRQQLSQLLRTSMCGTTNDLDGQSDFLQHTLLYCIVYRVTDIPPGVYRYQPERHALELVRQGPMPYDFHQALSLPNAYSLFYMSVNLFPVGNYKSGFAVYGDRWYRMQNMEAGMIAQRLYLAAAAQNLGCRASLGFPAPTINRFLGLSGGLSDAEEDPKNSPKNSQYTSLMQIMVAPERTAYQQYEQSLLI